MIKLIVQNKVGENRYYSLHFEYIKDANKELLERFALSELSGGKMKGHGPHWRDEEHLMKESSEFYTPFRIRLKYGKN